MSALNCWSLFLAGIATGYVFVCMGEGHWKWAAIFGAIASFNLLIAFV